MRLGLSLGYQTSWSTPADHLAMAQEAERLGYSVVWAADRWSALVCPAIQASMVGESDPYASAAHTTE